MAAKNEGAHMLPEFVCTAIPDPSLNISAEVWQKTASLEAPTSGHRTGSHAGRSRLQGHSRRGIGPSPRDVREATPANRGRRRRGTTAETRWLSQHDCAPIPSHHRRGGRAAECAGLENRKRSDPFAGSNPAPSALFSPSPVNRTPPPTRAPIPHTSCTAGAWLLSFDDYTLEYLPRAIRKLKSVSGSDRFNMLG